MNCVRCEFLFSFSMLIKHLICIASFRTFGPLRYARITIEHSTGRNRGTGFACFWNKEDADKALAQSDILKSETMGSVSATSTSVSNFRGVIILLTYVFQTFVRKRKVTHSSFLRYLHQILHHCWPKPWFCMDELLTSLVLLPVTKQES